MHTLALLDVEQSHPDQAEPTLRRCVELLSQLDLPEGCKWHKHQAQSSLGYCLLAKGQYQEAETLLLAGYQKLHAQQGEAFFETRLALQRIVDLYEAWGKADEAAQWRAKSFSAAWSATPASPSRWPETIP